MPAHLARSGPSAPVFDAVMVGVKPWRTPHRTAWVRLVTSILRKSVRM